MIEWTEVQERRLNELNAEPSVFVRNFPNEQERNRNFQELEHQLVKQEKDRLKLSRNNFLRPGIVNLSECLATTLIDQGFVQVATPLLMSKGHLKKMCIDESHSLFQQVYWVDNKYCLRPMLAPHLYYIVKDLLRLWEPPVRIFEIGSCFRKESKGALHASEFTMINLAEFGLPQEDRETRLRELIDLVVTRAGINDYKLRQEDSAVYGQTLDVEVGSDDLEVGSASIGPHFLDSAWRITTSWIGAGFGLERLLMGAKRIRNIQKVGRSLSYLNGIRLNI